jgi:OTU domain-containing protein 3
VCFPIGNCLFNALSDQLVGHQNDHHKIRTRVIEYMREHASYYKQFIDVQPGGGQRRNPKRKNAGVYSTPQTFTPPTEEEIDRVFEGHLGSMARGGTYGDNMEISAFTSAFGYDVKIYQHDFAYMISTGDGTPRPVAHIAYHVSILGITTKIVSLVFRTRLLTLRADLGTLLFDTKYWWTIYRTTTCQRKDSLA